MLFTISTIGCGFKVIEVVELVQQHRIQAVQAVQAYTNQLYWDIGELIIKRLQ